MILFSPKPPRCGRNIVLPVLLLCRRCIFHMNKPGHKLSICPYFQLQTFNKLILHLLHDHCSPEKLNFTCQSQLSRKFSWTIFDNNFCNFQQKRLSDCIHLHFVFTSLMAPSQKTFCPQKNCKKVRSIQYHLQLPFCHRKAINFASLC